jgi:hypothetical protein
MTANGASALHDQISDNSLVDLISTLEDSLSSTLRSELGQSNCTMAARMLSSGTTLSSSR